jgi:hypothetical protein
MNVNSFKKSQIIGVTLEFHYTSICYCKIFFIIVYGTFVRDEKYFHYSEIILMFITLIFYFTNLRWISAHMETSCANEDGSLLGCSAMWTGMSLPTEVCTEL